ncbi:hypothetical protein [Isoptericola sp. NPDC057653]|uniref:hypothetical protein n=1 Tax=Isoptericola sp. NPDC057653 TaxID=3346195 RepID=UPI0036BE1564
MSLRRARTLPAVVALLALGACGSPSGGPGGSSSTAPPADPDEVAAAAAGWGAAPQYVLTTSAEPFAAVATAAGVYGADGFSLVFSDPATAGAFLLSATGNAMTADDCPRVPLLSVTGDEVAGPVTCTDDGDLLERAAGDALEYVVQREDATVRLSGEAADGDALKEAARNVRVPSHDELAALTAGTPGGGNPLERGDLPPGDGAPDNSVGAGG